MSERKRMVVGGMTCRHCEDLVGQALEGAGAEEVEVSYRRGDAVFRGGDDAALARAVREAGYRPGAIERLAGEAPAVTRRGSGSRGYDLVVLGSGSAAFAAAIRASDLGARVAVVEAATVGGTCVNVGCVPSKALLRAAELQHLAGSPRIPGLRIGAQPPDLAQIVAWKDELVGTLRREKYLDLVELYGFDLLSGTAGFAGPDSVAVDGSLLSAESYLIATGASPAAPPIPGLAEAGFLTSTSALEVTELPARLAVIGANAIGLELGQYFARMGSRVTLIEVLPRIAPFEEPEISQTLTEALEAEGLTVLTDATVTAVSREGDTRRLEVVLGGDRTALEVDELLVATGRRPNTAALGLEQAGVTLDERGAVVTDEYLRTANPRVFAAGDVTGSPQFVYVSAYEGALAAENALNGSTRTLDLSALPRVTFTSPQVAAVGLTEAQAREAGYEVKTALLPLELVPRAIVNAETRGLIKLVADQASDRLLGAHLLAEHAGEVIQAAVLAVKHDLTVRDLTETFHPYLTIAEGIKLAAQTFGRDVATLSCCAA
ncbi:MAG TPA: mercury(II) reductase [Gaiellaceae bacterium]|nr:mercury(II) reductase [Gaiellaceae bacterium]